MALGVNDDGPKTLRWPHPIKAGFLGHNRRSVWQRQLGCAVNIPPTSSLCSASPRPEWCHRALRPYVLKAGATKHAWCHLSQLCRKYWPVTMTARISLLSSISQPSSCAEKRLWRKEGVYWLGLWVVTKACCKQDSKICLSICPIVVPLVMHISKIN